MGNFSPRIIAFVQKEEHNVCSSPSIFQSGLPRLPINYIQRRERRGEPAAIECVFVFMYNTLVALDGDVKVNLFPLAL